MTDVCERDPFCCSEPGHEGDCDQPFETEYRAGAHSPVRWLREMVAANERELRWARSAQFGPHESIVQEGLFG